MNEKHPIIFIAQAAGVVIALLAIYQFIKLADNQPLLWVSAIVFLAFVMLLLAVSMLKHVHRISPTTTWLPPPSRF